ncbi:unnamed protein product [Nyctereutes procyonoides]|uniref:(raccoon dog) hypothetical protein n=1 Tax=Nyctereutes procyonoides TaxID=34880 RepID=A0A811Z4P1_NYCPR|nr:unnamed protein product [Nyctereutes procyonoides]
MVLHFVPSLGLRLQSLFLLIMMSVPCSNCPETAISRCLQTWGQCKRGKRLLMASGLRRMFWD